MQFFLLQAIRFLAVLYHIARNFTFEVGRYLIEPTIGS